MQNAFQLLAALGTLAPRSPGLRQGAVTPGDTETPLEMPQSPNSLHPSPKSYSSGGVPLGNGRRADGVASPHRLWRHGQAVGS